MLRAPCRGLRHIMFPATEVVGRERANAYVRAAEICAGCPVRAECLDWALMDPEPMAGGVVAGLTPLQLAEARKAFAAERRDNYTPKCGSERAYIWHLERGEDCDRCTDSHNRKGQRYAEAAS